MNYEKSNQLREKAHKLIPGGAHTYAKGDDQFPELAPGFMVQGKGCHIWDADGNEFIEYGMGLRSVSLGHAYPEVIAAVTKQLQLGNNFGRPSTLEIECAEALQSVVGGEMIKFAKNGSDATSAAIKLARGYTGREMIAICGDQPFFSTDDWFIGSTPMNAGIPEVIRNLTVSFRYNDSENLEQLFLAHPGKIACLIMEAETTLAPKVGYLQKVQKLCAQHGVIFILDEMITGFRWHLGGAQKVYGITPDLSTFGKAMANGFAWAALVGRRDLMELGGLATKQEKVFLLSTTHGAESVGLAAAMATMKVYAEQNVIGYLEKMGTVLCRGIEEIISKLGLEDYFSILGHPANLIYATRDLEKNLSQGFRTLFMQETLKGGLLLPSFVLSYSHSEKEIEKTLAVMREVLPIYKKALEDGVDKYLVGRPVKPVFRKFN